jgi:hypothetical protein
MGDDLVSCIVQHVKFFDLENLCRTVPCCIKKELAEQTDVSALTRLQLQFLIVSPGQHPGRVMLYFKDVEGDYVDYSQGVLSANVAR